MVWDTSQLLRKSLTSLKALTLLLVMLMSVNMVWGEESYLLDFTTKSSSSSNYTNTWKWTVGSLEYSITNAANSNGDWAYVKFGGKGGSKASDTKTSFSSIESPSFGKAIESITMTSNNAASSISDFTLNSIVLTVTNGDNMEIDEVTKTSLSNSIEFTPTTGNKWAANCSYKITINWTIKGKSNIGLQVEKVEYAQAEIEPFSVTLKRYGQTDEVISNLTSAYTLPAVADEDPACEGWVFKGWSTDPVASTTTAPEFVAEATATGTYYAVYGKTESSGSGESNASVTIADYATNNGWISGSSSGPQYTSITVDDNITVTTTGTGNSGKYYSDWRLYQNGNGNAIVTAKSGKISSVTFTFSVGNNGQLKYNSSVVTSGTAVTGINSQSATFVVGASSGTTGQVKITKIDVTYSGGGTTTYTSSPECVEAGKTLISYNKNTEDEVTGDVPEPDEQENGVAYTVSTATLTRSGYTFKGWNTDKDATEGISTIPAASITGSPITLYAIWQAKTVQSVVVSGTPTKKNYEAGETFDPAGLTVTINYGDEQVVVTEGFVWAITPDNGVLTKGQTSVNVTATALGKTSAPYEVNGLKVTAAALTLTWDLTIDETATATEDEISWTSNYATMIDTRKDDKSTAANNYYPGTSGKTYISTRFYASSVLTIAPVENNTITKVEFTATSNSYATALKNSTWTNATSGDPVKIGTSDSYSLTVTPTDGTQAFSATIGGTCGFTAVKVYYQPGATMTSIAVKTAPKTEYNAGEFFNPAGLVITATYDDASFRDITYDANDTKWEFIPELTEMLTGKDNAVAITYNGVTIDPFLDITVNRLSSNLAVVSATKILTVNDEPSLVDWYTIDNNYDGKDKISFQSDDEEVFYVEGAEGLALAAGSATLTITAPKTDIYAQASVTVAVTVNAAAVPCSVKWMNNGEEYTVGGPSTVVNAGQKVIKLPTAPTPCDAQHVFKGWTNAAIATPQADAPSILFTDVAGAPTVDADNTVYYAVYAIESIDEDIDSYTFTSVGTVTEGVTTLTTSSGNTIRMDKGEGSNPPAWSSNQARLYAKGLMTVSSSDKISKVVYTYKQNQSGGVIPDLVSLEGNNSDAGSHDSETDQSGVTTTTWTSSTNAAKAVVLQLGGTKGNYGFTNVTIYTAGELVYSDYSTTCSAVELDKIELSGTYPTTFLQGDEFSHEGMTVTASYTNSTTTKNVTNLATFSGYDANTLGEQTITVSYTEGEDEDAITKTATYKVTVNDLPNKTIAQFLANPSKCYLSGIVSNITNTTYGNYTLTDASGSAEIYGTLTPSKESKQFATLGIAEGDKIKVIAENYSTEHSNITDVIFVEEFAFSAIAVSGTMSVIEYTEGNTLNSDGLVVKGKYADEDEAKNVITEGITWNMPKAVLGTSEYDVTATVGTLTSPAYHVTGITVNAAKVLTGITIVTEPKKTFWVGENFSTEGIQVTASYDGAADDDVTTLCTFSRAETQITDVIENETITVSYTEGTETKTATYTINANWMTLADLVENVTPTETAAKVWVKITDALVKVRNNSYLTTDVTYGDSQTKEVKIYKSGVDAAWVAGGTISGELKDVDWKLFNSDWELMPSDWTWATYTAPAPTSVTSVSLNESAIKVKVGKTATLVATVTPDNATDKSVTWSIVNDNANGKITVDQDGQVTVATDATVGATAGVKVTTTDGGFTATCTVTVAAVPTFNNGIWQKVEATTELNKTDYYIIASDNYEYAMKSYVNGGTNCGYVAITKDGNMLTYKTETQPAIFQLEDGNVSGQYAIRDIDSELFLYAAGASSNNQLKAQAAKNEDKASWTITVTEGTASIVAALTGTDARKVMSWNNNSTIFSCYKALQTNGQLALYKYVAGAYVISFNANGGNQNTVPGSIVTNEGKATIPTEIPIHGTRGNVFAYWTDDVAGEGTHYTEGQENCEFSANTTLYAQWQVMSAHHITYVASGAGEVPVDAENYYENDEVTLASASTLSNPGHNFAGWEVSYNDGEKRIISVVNNKFTMPDYDVTATAQWALRTNDKWVRVTDENQLVAGDKYVLACNSQGAVNGDLNGTYFKSVSATFSDDDDKLFITAMTGQLALTLGGETDAWTFAKDASNYLANSGTSLSWSTTASTWKIAFEDDKMTIVEGENNSLQYNTSSPRFKTYTSSQAAVQLYRLIPDQKVNGDVDASDLPEQANVTVNEGGNLLVTDGDIELGDIYVMEGGKVTIQTEATLTVNNFVIKSTMGGGESGQVLGVTSTNLTITGSAYFDVTLGDNGNPEKWHAFAVPFNVDAINGIYDLDDKKLTNEVNYAIMDYHGDVRATGAYGWKKFRGIMTPGTFYLMTVDGERTTYRMKMNGGFSASSSTISVTNYTGAGTEFDAGWNGIANNQLNYSSIGVDVQVLNPTSYTFETMTASTYNFTVGTPFFYQAEENGSVILAAANSEKPAYAPRMTAEAKNIAVTLGNNNYTDRLYISATDEATDEYQIGRDLVKMTMTNTPTVPQIFAEAYGTKLSMIDVPMMYDEAVYALNLYAPANGEYTIGAAQVDGYEVFLTQYGSVIWKLSMSEATIELTKGNNTEYGLILKATGAHAPTDINTLNGQESVQKFLYNSNIYIRHNNKTFNVQGQLVK